MHQKIIILDFGSQTTQLIGRRVRELNTFCEIVPYNKFPKDDNSVIGVILSGSPYSVHDKSAFQTDLSQFIGRIPVLGICYGAQYLAYKYSGTVEGSSNREYGRAILSWADTSDPLLKGITSESQVWMSHGDTITVLPNDCRVIASTSKVKNAAYASSHIPLWGVQFHPEVFHTTQGLLLLRNFVVEICGSKCEWSVSSFVETTIKNLQKELGDDKVILGLSGGVDSSVTAVLLNKAIGENLTCIFVDHGMLRKNEFHEVMQDYKGMGLNVIGVDASDKFFADLSSIVEPELKRKVIGRDFVEVFNAEARKISGAKWLAQGTIYPDRIESLSISGNVIKSHHNVGGLPKEMSLNLCEPLKWLFKDEVRRVGRELGMPEHLITRHPFPGPGLAVRILGEVTRDKVRMLQEADDIYIRGMRKYKVRLFGEDARRVLAAGVPANISDGEMEVSLYDMIWQAGAVLLSTIRSVGVMGDDRTYEHPVALRAVTSTDAMTADWAKLPYDFMADVSNEIINKVKGINRVCYDISSKPPATIEWE